MQIYETWCTLTCKHRIEITISLLKILEIKILPSVPRKKKKKKKKKVLLKD